MTSEKTQIRTDAKKIVSLTIAPVLVARIDEYAAEKKISRSAVIENAITNWFASPVNSPAAINEPENSLVQSDDCVLGQCLFASPQVGHAILYH